MAMDGAKLNLVHRLGHDLVERGQILGNEASKLASPGFVGHGHYQNSVRKTECAGAFGNFRAAGQRPRHYRPIGPFSAHHIGNDLSQS
ncbi:MAG TPA: hypothetical protein VMD98_06810 [Bryocella sp.]|nr:hypothetical protein [Bryocella sp.]